MTIADRPLLIRLRAREPEACEAFVDAHYRGVYAFLVWLTNDPEAAADLTQETFAGFWVSTARLDPARAPDLKAWLYGIARNRWRKRVRTLLQDSGRVAADLERLLEAPDKGPGPEAVLLTAFDSAELARAVSHLPADYREALVLRAFQEMSYAEIAEALGIGQGLARWRVNRARVWLRQALADGSEASMREEKSGV
ncbi:MAG: RNA polymerase sigma factor [Actinomycetota bacterium]